MRSTRTTTTLLFAASLTALGAQAAFRAVPTYEAVGVYWTNPGTGGDCAVQFRPSGSSTWTSGLDLWYDARNDECRGSLVNLTPGTTYDIQAGPKGGGMSQSLTTSTWSNTVPVAKVVPVSASGGMFTITEGGTAAGYVVYDGGGATLDAANASQFNVQVNASYVVVRNLVLKGAMQDAIRISPNVSNVIVEDNDISGWGRTRDGTLAADMDSGVRAICSSPTLTKVTIQRNRIHDPRYPANSWDTAHPAGAQGITFSFCGGNHVIRHNEIYSNNGNHYNDGIGGEDNFSQTGFPNLDSDIYGNIVSQANDDGIESEGGNQNVRVWGNWLDQTGTGVASTVVSIGPMYIFRNVYNRSRFYWSKGPDQDDRQPMMKAGSDSANGHGRRYVFHNTMLQPTQSGYTYPLGGGNGVGGAGIGIWNTVSKNNIWSLWKPTSAFYETQSDSNSERDMYSGTMGDMSIVNGIAATPQYASGNGDNAGSSGLYALAAGTPGYDQAVRIPNFNDSFVGNGPDVGAAEAGAGAMAFGVAASKGSAVAGSSPNGGTTTGSGSTGTGTGSGTTGTGSTGSGSTGTGGSGGTTSPSATMDSTAWTFNAGTSVTYTAKIIGTSSTPTGTVTFTANGAGLCAGVALSGGVATCTTTATPSGSVQIVGTYGGDGTYTSGVAGPITVTVNGTSSGGSTSGGSTGTTSLPTSFGMDSSSWTPNKNTNITFTATIPGAGGTVAFMDNGTTIAGCSAVAVSSSGIAKCTTKLKSGTHSVLGNYSGNGAYVAGVAGPITLSVKDAAASYNVQGLWWGGAAESGWGLNVTQQGTIVFASWFTYDAAGQPRWYAMSSMPEGAANTYTGAIFRTNGPAAAYSGTFDPSQVAGTQVGTATLTFSDDSTGTFSATVDGVAVNKAVTKFAFGMSMPTCSTVDPGGAANYQDLWWRSTESGWGLNIAQQGDLMFVAWFTYDSSGQPTWFFGPSVAKGSDGVFRGALYRNTGPTFNSAWNPAAVQTTPVGTVSFSFSDLSNGTFNYSVNGISGSKAISRDVYADPPTICRN